MSLAKKGLPEGMRGTGGKLICGKQTVRRSDIESYFIGDSLRAGFIRSTASDQVAFIHKAEAT